VSIRSGMAAVIVSALLSLGFQGSYRVGRLDVIRIEVAGEPELSREAAVSEKGTISYAMLGEISVEGLTVSEVSETIRKGLIERKILVQPAVLVSVKEYRSQLVTVLGEVKNPGKFFLKGPETVLGVIAEAGGITSSAGDVSVSRTDGTAHRVISIKAADLLTDATPIASGDVIFVRTRPVAQVFVSGDVTSGRPLNYNEGMTVSQAIVMAGGLTRFGSKSKITIRRTEGEKDVIIRVNLADIERGKARDVPLLPNDHVFVGRRIL
jgi:polysaccharide biosynthesis/export protein